MKILSVIVCVCVLISACNQSGNEYNAEQKDTSISNLLNPVSSDTTPPIIVFSDTSTNLNDTWVLDSLNSKPLNKDNFSMGLPYFEFNTDSSSVTGFTGCNGFDGKIKIENNKLVFGEITFAKATCKNMDFEKSIKKNISGKSVSYNFDSGKLRLFTGSKSYITFRRIYR